jgi:hypothetical protein
VAGNDRLRGLTAASRQLESWGCEREWVGTDPYEGLNARRLEWLKRTPLGRRMLIQLVKRSPLDLRRALAIEPEANPAALAHVLAAYCRSDWLPEEARRQRAERIVGRLASLRSPDFAEPCWAYPFDVESRVFFYPHTTPNTIATAFAALALLDADEALGARSALALAEESGDFFLRHVPQTGAGEGAFFGYFPGDSTPIHNANLLACRLLARLAGRTGRDDLRDAARRGVRFALARQRSDGSWPYGERPNLGWVDNFHTGYVLDSLLGCMSTLDEPTLADAYERGLRFYRERLFLADGTPRYLPGRLYPIDTQCVAQGIATFARAARHEPRWLEWAWRVYERGVERMRRPDGTFAFQRRRLWVNRAAHMRWAEAPMLDAMTVLHEVDGGAR